MNSDIPAGIDSILSNKQNGPVVIGDLSLLNWYIDDENQWIESTASDMDIAKRISPGYFLKLNCLNLPCILEFNISNYYKKTWNECKRT